MKKQKTVKLKDPPRFSAAADRGLSAAQVAQRVSEGQVNISGKGATRTVWDIVRSNLFTYFNLIFFLLAACVILVGSWRDLTFMPVILVNIGIGIVQELRSKRTLDKLNLLAVPTARVIRDGAERAIPSTELVLDDVVLFAAGNQIAVDATVLSGSVQVNESLLTGESDEIEKKTGDRLLSGSFITAGSCAARVDAVGDDSYVAILSREAKKLKKPAKSEMMKSLTRLIKVIGFTIIPVGGLLFYNQYCRLGLGLQRSVVSSVGAVIGMIPEGLYLLTSIALAVSTIILAKKRTLVHDLNCIETLARVNVLCVDKTGTITKPSMSVEELIVLEPERFTTEDVGAILRDHVGNLQDRNETGLALEKRFGRKEFRPAKAVIPFSSATKFSGAVYNQNETYLLGAPEFLLRGRYEEYASAIRPYADGGLRVLLLAMYDGEAAVTDFDSAKVFPIALVLLSNEIRDNAKDTFDYFARQGVEIKVISGDNPATVSNIAQKAGIRGAENFVDASTLTEEEELRAVVEYTVFGRVTPEQKRRLVRALKTAGKTVAMTGDGVNDVLALKSADCSVAMASGSDAACQVSQLVLLDSDFAAMPSVVDEGRRVINNIERSAALFIVKNIFSFVMALITMAAVLPYPVSSGQLSLVSMLTIGIPSFFLALEPDFRPVSGHFMSNVLFRAAPAGLTDVLVILAVMAFGALYHFPHEQLSTITAVLLSLVGLIMLFRTCRPFTKMRRILFIGVAVLLALCILFLSWFFKLTPLGAQELLLLTVLALAAIPIMDYTEKLLTWCRRKWGERKKN